MATVTLDSEGVGAAVAVVGRLKLSLLSFTTSFGNTQQINPMGITHVVGAIGGVNEDAIGFSELLLGSNSQFPTSPEGRISFTAGLNPLFVVALVFGY